MSVSTWVAAQKRLTDLDRKRVEAFNACIEAERWPPQDLIADLHASLGDKVVEDAVDNEGFDLQGDVLEVSLYGLWSGEIERDNGMVLNLDVLPEGTFAIRVYLA